MNSAIVKFGSLRPKSTYDAGFQLFLLAKALRAKPFLHVHEMVIAKRQIRTVRRVIKYFPLELSQFGRSTSRCMLAGVIINFTNLAMDFTRFTVCASRNLITKRISQLAGLVIAAHILEARASDRNKDATLILPLHCSKSNIAQGTFHRKSGNTMSISMHVI